MNEPLVQKSAHPFRMECSVSVDIAAPIARVWALISDVQQLVRWNSTITSLEGEIAVGNELKLRVPISPRTFTPKVTVLDAPRSMIWSDGFAPIFLGVRTFTLSEIPSGTRFEMREAFSGLMLPMIRGSLPDFGPPFEQWAKDLARASEAG
ncbi:MAG TPA: SRPBCC domain-containing protein [Polyangiaceae bacterium]|nr:SRPBCC domain-containing protein [Polyangiaceae bacterium]